MSTRRVTRSTTGALAERDKNAPVATLANAQVVGFTATAKSGTAKKRTASTKTESVPKRRKAVSSAAKPAKAATKPVATIAKRGWTLPHGMGGGEMIASNTVATSSSSADEPMAKSETDLTHKAEDKDALMPDHSEAPVSNVDTEAVAAKKEPADGRKRSARLASKNIKYNEDVLMSDDLPAPEPKAESPETVDSAANPAAKKGKKHSRDDKPKPPHPDFKAKNKLGATNPYGMTRGRSPYPYRTVPTVEQCDEVHRILVKTHGDVIQPAQVPAPSLTVAGCGEVRSVLDALLRTRISANTLMANSDRAIAQLAETYGVATDGIGKGSIDWNAVRLGSLEQLKTTIKVAGCATKKAIHIKAILDMVYSEQKARAQAHLDGVPVPGAQNEDAGQKGLEVVKATSDYLSLEHMRAMTVDEALDEFVKYPGIAVKTAACVVLFCLRIPCFAVDTHVHKISKWLGWVPEQADEVDTFNHGEHMIPDRLKYAFHQLFIRHGQDCFKCRKGTRPGTKDWEKAPACPLEHLLTRNKEMSKAGDKGSKVKEEDDAAEPEEVTEEVDTKTEPAKKTKGAKSKKKTKAVKVKREAHAKDDAVADDEAVTSAQDAGHDDEKGEVSASTGSRKGKGVEGAKKGKKAKVDKAVAAAIEQIADDNDQAEGDATKTKKAGKAAKGKKKAPKTKVAKKGKATTAADGDTDVVVDGAQDVEVMIKDSCNNMAIEDSLGTDVKEDLAAGIESETAINGSDELSTSAQDTEGLLEATVAEDNKEARKAKEAKTVKTVKTADGPVVEQQTTCRVLRSRRGL